MAGRFFEVLDRFAAVVVAVLVAALVVDLATDFFFFVVELVELWGEAAPAHAPMARAAHKATGSGKKVSRKCLV